MLLDSKRNSMKNHWKYKFIEFKKNCICYAKKLATCGLNKIVILYEIEEACSLFNRQHHSTCQVLQITIVVTVLLQEKAIKQEWWGLEIGNF